MAVLTLLIRSRPVSALVLRDSPRLRYATFFYLYVMQGVPSGFALTAVYNYLIGNGLSAKSVGSFAAIVGLPWTFQFVWGPLIDKYQYSIIGHRKQWVVLTQLVAVLASLSLLLVRQPVAQLGLMSAVFFVHSVFASIQDASVDAIAISVVPVAERGRVNAFMRAGSLFGWSVGGAALAYVLHFGRAHMQAASPASPEEENPPLGWLFRELWRSMVEKHSLQAFTVIILSYLAASLFANAYVFYLIHTLRWPDAEVSILQGTWGSVMSFGVLLAGGVLVDRLGAGRLQRWALVGLAGFLLVFNALSFLWVSKAVSFSGLAIVNLADPLLSVAAMPLLMAYCRPKIEGSQFTTYMALVNLCTVTASYLNGQLLEITTAPVIGFCCGLLLLALVVAASRLRMASPVPVAEPLPITVS
ncbi:MAG: MFS transporter [Hymenobacter sp.]|nr:MAG: MFS transporter [Hymenobacter sp.]